MFHNDNENSDMSTIEINPFYLLRPFFDKGHNLYTENHYTTSCISAKLFKQITDDFLEKL